MQRYIDRVLTAMAPIIWGTTYYVTTEFLPSGYPITAAMLRALPAGLFLLLITRQLPQGVWWGRVTLLGALNFSIFMVMLFIAAYRLPGGIAAIVIAMTPLIVIFLSKLLLKSAINRTVFIAAVMGVLGVALLVLSSTVVLDLLGVLAALGAAFSMALGIVLTKKWQAPVSPLTFTAWQLTAGGVLLLPLVWLFEPPLPPLSSNNVLGFIWLGGMGAIVSYFFWFRGITRLDVSSVSILGFLSPLTAVLLGWILLEEYLGPWQILGVLIVLLSIGISQRQQKR